MEKIVYSVSEVTRFIRDILEAEDILQNIWIRGEISNFKIHTSGHIYFTLKDENSQLKCVMFRSYAEIINFEIKDGMSVLVFGSISVYEKNGEYQLYVREIQPEGIGALYLAFEKLKKKLEREGLFSQERKKPIPKFPQKIVVITSPTGAAIRDILTTIKKRFPKIHIILIPTIVQGNEAKDSIIESLKIANTLPDIDVIILARGGGSLEDIWSFNEEEVARCIAESKIPVVTGIGHETDFTIADFVADMRAPTPTGAAQLVVPDIEEINRYFLEKRNILKKSLLNVLKNLENKLIAIKSFPAFKYPLRIIRDYQQRLDELEEKCRIYLVHNIQLKKEVIKKFSEKLKILNPESILKRGYSITLKLPERVLIKSIKDIKILEKTEIIISDGKIISTVEEIREK
jgi:exodeoxyribonuclease VII large subunit